MHNEQHSNTTSNNQNGKEQHNRAQQPEQPEQRNETGAKQNLATQQHSNNAIDNKDIWQ
jgi:hypothetical protein